MRRSNAFVVTLLIVGFGWLSTPVCAQSDPKMTIAMIAVVAAHSADLSVTQFCLGAGRCHETNPWLGRFQRPIPFAVAKMTVASLGLLATQRLAQSYSRLAVALNASVASAYMGLAVHNARVTR